MTFEIPSARVDMLTRDPYCLNADLNTYLHGQVASELHMLDQKIYESFKPLETTKIGEGVIDTSSDFILREFVN